MKAVAARLMLVGGSLLVACLGAEGVLRLALAPPQVVVVVSSNSGDKRAHAASTSVEGKGDPQALGLFISTPSGRRHRPNMTVRIRDHRTSGLSTEIRTNRLGYRNPEIGPKSAQRSRVLFLGDSITVADFLPEEQTFVRIVESLSRREGRPLETINAGVNGISLANELSILVESGLSLEPDVVVLGFCLNDVHPSKGVRPLEVPEWLSWSFLAGHSCALWGQLGGTQQEPTLEETLAHWEKWFRLAEARYPAESGNPRTQRPAFFQRALENFQYWGNMWLAEAWDSMRPCFDELARLSRVHHFKLLVICFPVLEQVEADFVEDYPQRTLATLCDELGVAYLDLLPDLRAWSRETAAPLFFDNCHHTAVGHRKIADRVLLFLRENE